MYIYDLKHLNILPTQQVEIQCTYVFRKYKQYWKLQNQLTNPEKRLSCFTQNILEFKYILEQLIWLFFSI